MKNAIAAMAGLAALAAMGMVVASSQATPKTTGGAKPAKGAKVTEILGWKIENGRFAEGPYAGFWAQSPDRPDKVKWTEEEWRSKLTKEQFRILRSHGTEPAFCGVFHDHKQDGVYKVVAINHPVFKSDAKFDSGTGWPSFFQPYDKDAIWLRPDLSYGMVRMEVLDSKSDGHLGHVFEDGPREKTGLRFCINSEVLEFVPMSQYKAEKSDGN